MVKLYTDEEMNEKCKDYDPIPMLVAQDVLHRKEPDDRVNILNGVVKSPYKIGQPPASVNMYASQIGSMTPVSADKFIEEYNRFVGNKIIEKEKEIEQSINLNAVDPQPIIKIRKRRTKNEMFNAYMMGIEDINVYSGLEDPMQSFVDDEPLNRKKTDLKNVGLL